MKCHTYCVLVLCCSGSQRSTQPAYEVQSVVIILFNGTHKHELTFLGYCCTRCTKGHQFESLDQLWTCWQALWISNVVTLLSNRCLNALEEGRINLINPNLNPVRSRGSAHWHQNQTVVVPGSSQVWILKTKTKSMGLLLTLPWWNACIKIENTAAGNQTERERLTHRASTWMWNKQ